MEHPKAEEWLAGGNNNFDVVVVGSGYGGSVAACRLAMAGLKVCLLEKGRKWEAQDFPTDTFQMISAVRIEDRTFGFSFGPKNALYQLCRQDDSLAAMACGLGGGSLVNAGVMMPTPARTRRNPKWPQEWEKDWEVCQDSASRMLKVQDLPIKFQNQKIMHETMGEETGLIDSQPVKLTVNFDIEDQMHSSNKVGKADSCQACGNCLSGCPYNAKNSTDKTYLVSAIQAGCVIKTECEVQYVVRNLDDTCEVEDAKRKRRRWLVFLNEFDYVTSDFVVLSAGVFGTAKILFQSQTRGLMLSKKLGFGLSCNGNNVAYLTRSKAPLNACGLDKKKLIDLPFEERPGPSITSSYISSLGFTIQSASLPIAFPWLLFKGITTYGWPNGYNFLDSVAHKLNHLFSSQFRSQDMVLNVIGHDSSDGKITFHKESNNFSFQPPNDPLLSRKIETLQRITKKLGGILFMSRYRSTSVQHLGGCCASSDASFGVCNSNGQVFDSTDYSSTTTVHPGLYVCDGSLIPCSVGINPCLTIATLAEHVSKNLVQDALEYKSKNMGSVRKSDPIKMKPSGLGSTVFFKETMEGRVGGLPCTAYLKLQLNVGRRASKKIVTSDQVGLVSYSYPFLRGKAGGYVICCSIEMDKLHVIEGEVDLCHVDDKTPYTQYMHYRLLLAASSGSRYILEGKKVMNPFLFALDALKESTTLHVELRKISKHTSEESMITLKGKLHISMLELLKSLISMSGREKMNFLHTLLQSLFRTYISQVPRGGQKVFTPIEFCKSSYPSSTLHEIQTEDGIILSCKQWQCNQEATRRQVEEGIKHFPVLLINGYSTDSFCLPTESNDLVRSLLQKGHETWLLQTRLHAPSASSDMMTIQDIGMFDIPAAINKILSLHGESTKVHVVAHCVGGLALHIALMGGHVCCKTIASISCTNSSMFFKLTAWSKFKLWLPLLPISMAILGKEKSLPLFETLEASSRQKLLKSIARAIPRYERCTYDECEVFSGVFGNTFWHQNVSHRVHCWMNKEYLPRLPMAAFPHLRKICNAGFIVDKDGKNTYMVHPERVALPTLYISGGRTLLVTPETSFLANKFMKLHQPGFRHERVVVDGFGHSDLLIGEESSKKVFPHILSHIALTEKENTSSTINSTERGYQKDALSWADDPHLNEGRGFCGFISSCINVYLFLVCFIVLISFFCSWTSGRP